MKPEWEEYLDAIGATGPIAHEVSKKLKAASLLAPEPAEAIFLTEYPTEEGERVFEHLWFFTAAYGLECKSFLLDDNCDLSVIQSNIAYIEISWDSYDFNVATAKSRFRVRFQTVDGVEGDLRASGSNCPELLEVLEQRLRPNIWDPGG